MTDGVVIIGAGHGGSQAAVSLRQEGYDGPIRLVSDERDLPYHKPPLSKVFIKSAEAEPQPLRAESVYADNRVNLLFGHKVTGIDLAARRILLDGSTALPFDRLVLATGARPRPLTVPGADLAGVFALRSLADARALREALPPAHDVVVIGGGFIGLEAAAALAATGKRVTVLESADRLLGRVVAPEISAYMAELHASLGIRVLLSTLADHIEGTDRVRAVVTASGERIAADIVIVGVGAIPNAELAAAAGLPVANGIVAGPHLETDAPGVFALGDVASYPHKATGQTLRLESVQNATDQARHIARAITGRPDHFHEVPWFWSDQGPAKLQMAGLAIGADRTVLSGVPADGAFSLYRFRGPTLLAVESINRPADHMLARRMLAAGYSPTDAEIAAGPAAVKAAFSAASAATSSQP